MKTSHIDEPGSPMKQSVGLHVWLRRIVFNMLALTTLVAVCCCCCYFCDGKKGGPAAFIKAQISQEALLGAKTNHFKCVAYI